MMTTLKTMAAGGAVALAILASTAVAQQAAPVPSTPQVQVQQVAPPAARSYRSYSVRPSSELRGTIRYAPRHSSEATWRHGDSKAMGNYRSGR